jgi:DNA-binding response OmpR family regulator
VRKQVLIADDHAETVDLFREALERAGFSVLTARNGAECLLAVETHSPDLVILDVTMPVLDGMQTLRVLRERPETRDLPVIILSGRDGFQDVRQGWRNGADLYLAKPIRVGAVIAAARWVLGSAQHEESPADEKLGGLHRAPV